MSGWGTELGLIGLVFQIVLVVFLILLKVIPVTKKAREERRRNNGTVRWNPGSKAGESTECQKRGVRLAVMETKLGVCEEAIKEIKRDIKDIKRGLA